MNISKKDVNKLDYVDMKKTIFALIKDKEALRNMLIGIDETAVREQEIIIDAARVKLCNMIRKSYPIKSKVKVMGYMYYSKYDYIVRRYWFNLEKNKFEVSVYNTKTEKTRYVCYKKLSRKGEIE